MTSRHFGVWKRVLTIFVVPVTPRKDTVDEENDMLTSKIPSNKVGK